MAWSPVDHDRSIYSGKTLILKRMKVSKYLLAGLIFWSLVHCAMSQTSKPATAAQKKEILSNMESQAAKTSTLTCRFVQKKNISILSETVTSEGMMYFKKENKLRWEYNKPYSYLFILNEGTVSIKNNKRVDQFDTKSNKMFQEISEIMIGGVRGTLLTDNKKFITQFLDGEKIAIVKLIPKNKEMKQMMSAITLTISKSDWLVKSIEMEEQGGDNTIITFVQKDVNKNLSDNLFRIN